MARQPTRLADFEIPRGENATPDLPDVDNVPSRDLKDPAAPFHIASAKYPEAAAVSASKTPDAPVADIVPVRIAPRPAVEARQAMTVRLPVSMHERIRTLMFTSRRSQQDIVEDALHAFLAANGT